MTVRISDRDFLSPAEINLLDCYSADRYLHRVDETVTISRVCQDSNNASLVIIDFSLVGAFMFTPYCEILEVDGDTSYTTNGIRAPLALGHYKNPTIPIDTQCHTFSGSLVFDFGAVIPSFLYARSIVFRLGMVGEVPLAYGVSYPNQTPTYTYTWSKGVLPSPVGLSYVNGNLEVIFEYNGDVDCSCDMRCLTMSGVLQSVRYCPGERRSFVVEQSLNGDPFTFVIQVGDSIGNTYTYTAQTMLNTDVRAPVATLQTEPACIKISIPYGSMDGTLLDGVEYQILRYHNTVNNNKIWRDWSSHTVPSVVDLDYLPGQVYGYAIRYRGKFKDISNLSDWSTVST